MFLGLHGPAKALRVIEKFEENIQPTLIGCVVPSALNICHRMQERWRFAMFKRLIFWPRDRMVASHPHSSLSTLISTSADDSSSSTPQ